MGLGNGSLIRAAGLVLVSAACARSIADDRREPSSGPPPEDSSIGGSPDTEAGGATSTSVPTLCTRLRGLEDSLQRHVSDTFEGNVYCDCRVARLIKELDVKADAEFLSRLDKWSFRLWGCGPEEAEGFALAPGAPELSERAAELLIEHYLAAATLVLRLSRSERAALQQKLEELSQSAIQSDAEESALSDCMDPNAVSEEGAAFCADRGTPAESAGGRPGS
jgi:hypothetical protein